MCFYCLNHLVCDTLYWQAWKMNTVFGTTKGLILEEEELAW